MKAMVEGCFEVSSVRETSNELVKMVRKLRWIGMEDEAKRLQTALSALPSNERETVLAGPPSTD